jgi:beta-lactamase regulating signal transducer with metallopeptidase domain
MDVLVTAFGWLVRASWRASVLAAVVLLVQWALGSRLPARWRHALWWLVLARLLLPSAPASPLSLFNHEALGLPAILSSASRPASTAWLVAAWIWLAGALAMVGRVFWESQRLAFAIARQRPVTDSAVLNLFEDCKATMKLHTPVLIVETPHVGGPALHGFLRPRLLLPRGLLRTLPPADLRFVFLHELAHLERHDIAMGWLMAVLQALHWFNPLVWFAFHRMRSDRELAADEAALWRSGSRDNRDYGETILKLLEQFSRPVPLPAMVGILEDRNQMTRRIRHIARFGGARQWTALAFALFLVLAVVGLTDGRRQPGDSGRAEAAGRQSR